MIAPSAIFTQSSDPNALLGINEVLFYPNVPLPAATTFNVSIVGTNAGTALTKTFSFATS